MIDEDDLPPSYEEALSIRPLPPRLPPSASNTTSTLPISDAQISDPGQPLPQQISGQAPPSIASAGRPPAPHHHPPPQAATDNAEDDCTVRVECTVVETPSPENRNQLIMKIYTVLIRQYLITSILTLIGFYNVPTGWQLRLIVNGPVCLGVGLFVWLAVAAFTPHRREGLIAKACLGLHTLLLSIILVLEAWTLGIELPPPFYWSASLALILQQCVHRGVELMWLFTLKNLVVVLTLLAPCALLIFAGQQYLGFTDKSSILQCIGSGVVLPVATILYLKAMTEKTINGFGEESLVPKPHEHVFAALNAQLGIFILVVRRCQAYG